MVEITITIPFYISGCGRQLDRHEQSKEDRPDTEGHQGRQHQVPSNRQN